MTITPELRAEGLAREVVKRIQTFRKESGFEITDRIAITIPAQSPLTEAVETFKDYIASQVLADKIMLVDDMPANAQEFNFEEFKVLMHIEKTAIIN